MDLATQYFEKGYVPTTFKWLLNEDMLMSSPSIGIIGSENNHESDGTYTDEDKAITTERNVRTYKKIYKRKALAMVCSYLCI